jgi:hypothetical protein
MNKWGDLSRLIHRYFVCKSQSQSQLTSSIPLKTTSLPDMNTLQARVHALFSDRELVNIYQKKEHNESSS